MSWRQIARIHSRNIILEFLLFTFCRYETQKDSALQLPWNVSEGTLAAANNGSFALQLSLLGSSFLSGSAVIQKRSYPNIMK